MKNKYSLITNIFIGLGLSLLFASGLLFLKVGDVKSAGTINLQAIPSTIDLGSEATKTTDIQYSFRGHTGDTYHLWITSCDGTYIDKVSDEIRQDTDPNMATNGATNWSYSWSPEQNTCSTHKVRIKTFNSAGDMTDSVEKTVSVTGTSSTGGGGTESGGETTDGGSINLHLSDLNSITLKNFMPGKGCNENLEGIICILEGVINIILDLAGIVAFIMILYASIIYLTSYGEESRAELAKKTLIWSVIGVIVIVLSKAILFMIQNLILKKGI